MLKLFMLQSIKKCPSVAFKHIKSSFLYFTPSSNPSSSHIFNTDSDSSSVFYYVCMLILCFKGVCFLSSNLDMPKFPVPPGPWKTCSGTSQPLHKISSIQISVFKLEPPFFGASFYFTKLHTSLWLGCIKYKPLCVVLL